MQFGKPLSFKAQQPWSTVTSLWFAHELNIQLLTKNDYCSEAVNAFSLWLLTHICLMFVKAVPFLTKDIAIILSSGRSLKGQRGAYFMMSFPQEKQTLNESEYN